MIRSFSDDATENIYDGISSKRALKWPREIWARAVRKLDMLEAANELVDLQVPPGNRLEELKGDLKGFYSIRINDRYRIVFRWREQSADDVRIDDYH